MTDQQLIELASGHDVRLRKTGLGRAAAVGKDHIWIGPSTEEALYRLLMARYGITIRHFAAAYTAEWVEPKTGRRFSETATTIEAAVFALAGVVKEVTR